VDAGESSLWTAPRRRSWARPSLVGALNVGVGSSDLGFASCVHSSSRRHRAGCRGDRARVIAIFSLRRRGDEIRVTAALSTRPEHHLPLRGGASTSTPFQTLISHVDAVRCVALNHDGIIAITSLRRRGDENRVTAARSQHVPSIDFLSAAGRALPPDAPSRH